MAVRDSDSDGSRGWLLHAGDAYFHHGEVEHTPPLSHPVLDPVQQGAQTDAVARVAARDRLRDLLGDRDRDRDRDHAEEVTVFSAHDPWELARALMRP
ncbi:hypothetical protein GCM10010232_46350 [Streptomyces amakusaensis]|uniref:Uncharacterized protein n=1 Tax=Streptomyces amakusaensis TaxID=67271 RepID=A0ABW0AHK8_9ACTN